MKYLSRESKLLYMSSEQKNKLLKIQEEVSNNGGVVSVNQLILDSIDLMIAYYTSDIVNRYVPLSLEDIIPKK